ncbi:hypothetical protein [Pseudoalteromonas sp. BMB]|uniref:hypothetical protein n=1 Tax=Pseudoalteromonas sp. BMB TaxID=1874619 RepID=UPI001586D8FE|nr:hypothetical protein [Pseudoalteromonas sp. BMB]
MPRKIHCSSGFYVAEKHIVAATLCREKAYRCSGLDVANKHTVAATLCRDQQ